MSNDIDVFNGGGLQPYSPSQPLAPAPVPDFSGNTEVDLLRESTNNYTGGGQLLFGQYPVPAGFTVEQITEAYTRLAGSFCADMMKCGMNVTQSQESVQWFLNAIKNPPARKHYQHPYDLYEHRGDNLFEAYAAHAHSRGYPQRFITACAWWVTEAGKRLAAQNVSGTPMPRTAPQSKDPADSLSDAEFERVVKINQQAAMQTEITLRRKWGDSSYVQNVQVAQRYLDSLPPKERQHFEQFTTGWVKALNTAEVIEGLFNMAIGAANIPTSGGAVQAEISQIERLMRDPVSRRAYLKDNQMQARLRTLYTMRDGG
ncbi:hypothetical protein QVM62_06835 [Pseudomonas putida]|uniref:hypothetical protein n=1 Tax=Pseudomonas TaxID=286 RepID=UPI003524167F